MGGVEALVACDLGRGAGLREGQTVAVLLAPVTVPSLFLLSGYTSPSIISGIKELKTVTSICAAVTQVSYSFGYFTSSTPLDRRQRPVYCCVY